MHLCNGCLPLLASNRAEDTPASPFAFFCGPHALPQSAFLTTAKSVTLAGGWAGMMTMLS